MCNLFCRLKKFEGGLCAYVEVRMPEESGENLTFPIIQNSCCMTLDQCSSVCRLKKSREDFVRMLEESEERSLSRFSRARELFEDDPRWKVGYF